jgi:hypothetical protein
MDTLAWLACDVGYQSKIIETIFSNNAIVAY